MYMCEELVKNYFTCDEFVSEVPTSKRWNVHVCKCYCNV